MKKKILVYMEVDTNNSDSFIKHDIEQELNCCSCSYENIIVNVIDIEENKNDNN